MKVFKKYPKLSITLSIIALLGLCVFTMYLTHPIITWLGISSGVGFCFMIDRSCNIESELHDFRGWLVIGFYCSLFIVTVLPVFW